MYYVILFHLRFLLINGDTEGYLISLTESDFKLLRSKFLTAKWTKEMAQVRWTKT